MQARVARYLLFLALAFPAFLPFNFVYRFGVNIPYWDQWDFVPTLVHFHEGNLSLDELTVQHNEHRIFFPRLIMLGLSAIFRYDVRAEMYFNALLLVALYAVLLHAHVRAFGASNRSLLAFLPVPWIVFTFRQFENLIWGWQIQITLCALCVVVALRLLEEVRGLGARLAGAIAAAFVATFSFGSGISLWPVGLIVLLWQGRREGRMPWRAIIGWGLAAVLALGLYARNYHSPPTHPDPLTFLKTPWASFVFLLNTLGSTTTDIFATSVTFGALLLVSLVVVLVELRRQRAEPGPLPLALGLVLFAGAVAFLVMVGRVAFGRDFGLSSRYTTLTLLGFVGLHRALLALREPLHRGQLMGILLSAAVATGVWSFSQGIYTGYVWRNDFRKAQEAVRTLEASRDSQVERVFPSGPLLRERAAEMQRLGLSIFAPGRQPPSTP